MHSWHLNNDCFSFCLNVSTECAWSHRSAGKLFHILAPVTAKKACNNVTEKCHQHCRIKQMHQKLISSQIKAEADNSMYMHKYKQTHSMTMTSCAITLYGQCCRCHLEGQQIVSDISVVYSCLGSCSLCSDSNNTNLLPCLLFWCTVKI